VSFKLSFKDADDGSSVIDFKETTASLKPVHNISKVRSFDIKQHWFTLIGLATLKGDMPWCSGSNTSARPWARNDTKTSSMFNICANKTNKTAFKTFKAQAAAVNGADVSAEDERDRFVTFLTGLNLHLSPSAVKCIAGLAVELRTDGQSLLDALLTLAVDSEAQKIAEVYTMGYTDKAWSQPSDAAIFMDCMLVHFRNIKKRLQGVRQPPWFSNVMPPRIVPAKHIHKAVKAAVRLGEADA